MLAYLNRREGARTSIEPVVKYGTPAPDLQVAHWLTADGPGPAPDTRGKVVLIDFWGITCAFCVAQLDDVRAAAKHLTADDFLLIGLHDADGTVAEVAAFARDRDLRYQLAIDRPPTEEGWFGATTQAFGVRGIPQAAVIDREGKVVYLGEFDQALTHVGRLLNGAASNP
jgi:peroxiredoxin